MTLVQGWYLVQVSPKNKIHQLLSHTVVGPGDDTHEPTPGENYQESESSVESPLPMICTRKIYS